MKKAGNIKSKRKIYKAVLAALLIVLCMEDTVYAITNKSGCENMGTVTASYETAGLAYNGYYKKSGNVKVVYDMGQPMESCSNTTYQYVGITNQVEVPVIDASETNASGGGHVCNGHTSNEAGWRHWFGRSGSILYGMETNNIDSVTVSEEEYKQCKYAIAGPSKSFGDGLESNGRFYWVVLYKRLPSDISNETVDDTPPTIALSAVPSGKTAVNLSNGKTYGREAVLMASAVDRQSRPHKTKTFRFKSQNGNISGWIAGNSSNKTTATSTYKINANGSYYVETMDQLGNSALSGEAKVDFIDATPPTAIVSKGINQKVTVDGKDWTATTVTLSVAASDSEAGLGREPYCFDGVTWTAFREYVVSQNGIYQVKVQDALGNMTTKSITVDNFDRQAPKGDVTMHYENGITLEEKVWSKEAVTLQIQAFDEGCGLDEMPYSFDGGASWVSESSFSFTENGKKVIKIRDSLHNINTIDINIDGIDKIPPVIKEIQLDTIHKENQTALVKIIADDNEGGCGLEGRAYSFDGGKTWTEKNEIMLSQPSLLNIQVRDRLGNTAQEIFKADFILQEAEEKKEQEEENKESEGEDTGKKGDAAKEQEGAKEGKEDSFEDEKEIAEKEKVGRINENTKMIIGDIQRKGKEQMPEALSGLTGIAKAEKNIVKAERKSNKAAKKVLEAVVENGEGEKNQEDMAGAAYQVTIPILEEEIEPIIIQQQEENDDKKGKDKNTVVKKVCMTAFTVILSLGFLGFLFWYLFVYCKYKAVLFGKENGKYKRLGILMITKKEEQQQIEVPDELLQQITGHYYRIKVNRLYLSVNKGADIFLLIEERMVKKQVEKYIDFYLD